MASWAQAAVTISCFSAVASFDFAVKFQTPEPTIVFEKAGRLWPSVNYGHIRATTNVTRLRQLANGLRARTNELEELINYTAPNVLDKLAPGIPDKLLEGGIWPSPPFKMMMRVAVSEIQSKCISAQNDVELLETIFRSIPVGHTTQHQQDHEPNFRRPRRQIAILAGVAIGLLFAGFSIGELFELSSRVSAIESNQRHIIAAVHSVIEQMQHMEHNLEGIANATNRLALHLTMQELETHLLETAQISIVKAGEISGYVTKTTQGLYLGIEGRLSPSLVDSKGLERSIKQLVDAAKAKDYAAISSTLLHIFELPCSLYVHPDRDVVDSILHVPLMQLKEERVLWKRSDLPYIIAPPSNLEDTSLPKDKNHVWNIKKTSQLVASSINKDQSYEIDEDSLKDCVYVADNYYCRHLIKRTHESQTSCEVALFHGKLDNIYKLCKVEFSRISEAAILLNEQEALIYSREQVIDVTCKNGSEIASKAIRIGGTVKRSMPIGLDCDVLTEHHKWRTDSMLGFDTPSRVLPIPINISRVLGPIGKSIKENIETLVFRENEAVSFREAKIELEQTTESYREYWVPVLCFIIVGVIVCAYVYMRQRKTNSKVKEVRESCRPMSVEFARNEQGGEEEASNVVLVEASGSKWRGRMTKDSAPNPV